MKKELFIKKVKSKGIIVILYNDDPIVNLHMLDEFKKLKGFFRHINFDCQIKKSGGCKENSEFLKCCCSDCLWSIGYFRRMLDKDLTYYSKHFSFKTGFWRKGKGCILPHKMRSVTCLTYHCNHSYQDKSHVSFDCGIYIIKDELVRLRKLI
jgi:hypothetical protein